MDDPGGTHEAAPAPPRPAVQTGTSDPPGGGRIEWRRAVYIPETGIAAEADVRECDQWGVTADGVSRARNDGAWLSLHRLIAAERKWQMERRRDRARFVPRGWQSGPRGLSSRRSLG